MNSHLRNHWERRRLVGILLNKADEDVGAPEYHQPFNFANAASIAPPILPSIVIALTLICDRGILHT